MNLDLKGFHEPDTAVTVRGRTGPVVVTIEYRIAEEDTYAFLSAMAERRQVRRRNGARRWSLLRDPADPGLRVESTHKIGRETVREKEGQYEEISGVDGTVKKK